MTRPHRPRFHHASRGASLIEVLVAVLVLSIGMLGLAALQARSLQGNASSLHRTQGVVLAQHVLDLLRADRAGGLAGSYDTGADRTCAASAVPGDSAAADRLRDWLDTLKAHMGRPGDATTCARVRCDASAVCTIDIFWDDRLAGGRQDQSLTITSRL